MRLLSIETKKTEINGVIVNRYEVKRPYTEAERKQIVLTDDQVNYGVIIETFNSYENARWFMDSIKLIKHVNDVLESCQENEFEPKLMVRTPKRLNEYMKNIPKTLLNNLAY